MKLILFPLGWIVLATSLASAPAPTRLFESSLQGRAGIDSNPTGMSGAIPDEPDSGNSFTFAAGANFSLTLSAPTQAKPLLKISYAGETVRYADYPGEDYATHRLGLNGQATAGHWKISGENSALFVDGSSDTLISVSSMNANAIPLWRERRRQWQHRLKLQGQADFGTHVLRTAVTRIGNDYLTRVTPGKIAFADRSDLQVACDVGWKRSTDSLWLGGVRMGRQQQAIVPLPNCAFDYSNDYSRLVAGWEGKPFAHTTVTLAAGPNFSHYSGAIDPRVFLGGRNRTSFWYEANFVAKPTTTLTLSGRATQMDWLASTGKSAYSDSSAESAATLTLTPAWTVRFTAKMHRCDYFPAVRDDWESFLGTGTTLKASKRTLLTLDVLRHRAWNRLTGISDREFQRWVVSVGATIAL